MASYNNVYEDKNKKASDYKSSAYALIIVSIVAMILIVLVFLDVIKLNMTPTWKNISCAIMGIFSLFLFVTGIFSIKSFKSILNLAKEEDKISEEILKWSHEELTKDYIDNILKNNNPSFNELNEGDLFFHRSSIIEYLLKNKFMNLENKYADHMIEIIYQDIFENDD